MTTTLLTLALLCSLASAEVVVNWEGGFEVDLPNSWLRRDLGADGLMLSSDRVRMQVEPYSGITLEGQIDRLHQLTKADRYEFKTERSFVLNQTPAHEMIFFKNGEYKIYYVVMAGVRGFLWTVESESTDSPAFLESQQIIYSFKVQPR
jgi:hypothetical protein